MFKRLFLIGTCFAAAFSASAIAAEPTYVVGSGGTYRPFEYENAQKQLEGFDIDIIKAVAKAFLPLWVQAIATSLFPALPSPTSASRWLISLCLTSRLSNPLWCQKVQRLIPLPR
jgi:ABC-type amino acid transport substrate-binding protein